MTRSEAAPPSGEPGVGGGGFSATLATLTAETGKEPGEAAANETELAAAIARSGKSGKALPLADNTGKRLPAADGQAAEAILHTPIESMGPGALPLAPKPAADDRTEKQRAGIEAGAEKPETDDATDAPQTVVASTELALLPLTGAATSNEDGPAFTLRGKTTARPLSAQTAPALANSDQQVTAESKASANQQAQAPTAPAVALTIASQSTGQSERPLKGGGTTKDVPATKAAVKAHAVVPTNVGEAPSPSESPAPASALAAASTSSPQTSPSAPAHHNAAAAFRPDAVQDLTRIVDRLAAAREALAPASAQLAIDHADFGELTLRFDQHRSGQLAVQLAAGNPEAHRAIAAAVADRPFSAAPDSSSGQAQSQTQSQAQARGEGGGREGQTGHGASARHEQAAQRRSSAQDGKHSAGNRPRSGLFA
ncbi:hypothetical protein [Croceibacterium aestuarii]|uniref:hypothetical protein n=1 Tax=Croceibacterium aestuarii TaxID=3064139 RepID=UPI00272ED13C|nr:hypothetical protein [Croceibacterium sp. D39]